MTYSLRTLLGVRRPRPGPGVRSLGAGSLRALMGRTFGQLGGFVPSVDALHYSNSSLPDVPDRVIRTPFGDIGVGNASDGLCGGMAFAVADLFEARRKPPASSLNPAPDSPAFRYVVDRLFDSFDLPTGVVQYYRWMNLPRDPSPLFDDGHATPDP